MHLYRTCHLRSPASLINNVSYIHLGSSDQYQANSAQATSALQCLSLLHAVWRTCPLQCLPAASGPAQSGSSMGLHCSTEEAQPRSLWQNWRHICSTGESSFQRRGLNRSSGCPVTVTELNHVSPPQLSRNEGCPSLQGGKGFYPGGRQSVCSKLHKPNILKALEFLQPLFPSWPP